jgi:hypothetical protein
MHTSPKYLPIPTAVEEKTGYRPHPVTCWRWSKKGIAGVKLQTWMIGGRRLTTLEAVQQFIDSQTKANSEVAIESSNVGSKLRKELYPAAI